MKRTAVAVTLVAASLLVSGVAFAEPGFSPAQVMPRLLGTTDTNTSPYASVSCPSSTSCTAVGPGLELLFEPSAASGGTPTAVTESSGTWGTPVRLSLPAGAGAADVNDVACVDSGDCVAVGGYKTTKTGLPYAATESSGTWGAGSEIEPPAGDVGGELTSVWCASVGNCVATGFALGTGSPEIKMFAVTEASGTWATAVTLPAIASTFLAIPVSMSCTDVDDCTLIADQLTLTGGATTLVWTETSGNWASPTTVPSPHGYGFIGYSVVCPTSTTCLAVGGLDVGENAYPASATETSGVWATAVRIPAPKLAPTYPQGAFTSLSCPSTTLCEAVGEMVANASGAPRIAAAVTWSAGTWSSIDLLHDVAPGNTELSSVSCDSTAACLTAGALLKTSAKSTRITPFDDTITPTRPVASPLSPTDVVGTPLRDGVVATWQPPTDDGGSPVTSFTATVFGTSKTCVTSAYRCQFSGLVDGHRYRIEVSDTTTGGKSRATISPPFVAGVAPTRPAGIHVHLDKTVAHVSWHASTAPAEHVEYYTVTVRLGKHVEATVRTKGPECALRLGAAHTYHVEITATDASGVSTPGTVVVHVT